MTTPATAPPHSHPATASRMTDAVITPQTRDTHAPSRTIGILPGEGIGPEVVASALQVFEALDARLPTGLSRITGGPIGLKASSDGNVTAETSSFCSSIFENAGALFCGPGGGRFVYDLRQKFDLFCKLAPLKPSPWLAGSTRLRREAIQDVDIVVVRDNAGGIYQGRDSTRTENNETIAEHTFDYRESHVEKILHAGAKLAQSRRRRMHVIVKDGGVPAISDLWKHIARRIATRAGVECKILNADYAAYLLVQQPRDFDVIVTPNMIGDILADLGGVIVGSRGLTFSGNFSTCGRAVYQTGHGAAYDLAGTGRANPVGQILALAMMLRESFGLFTHAAIIEHAIDEVWRTGIRTDDLCWPPGESPLRAGTREITTRIADAVDRLAGKSQPPA